MKILLNGTACELPAGSRIVELLANEGLSERRVAVEVNGEIIPRGLHGTHGLQEGDRVEVVHALGGG